MTPIEKAAEEVVDFLCPDEGEAERNSDIKVVHDIIRQRLGEEVTVVEPNDWPTNEARRYRELRSAGYKQCRRDIGLEDL